jgi:hypothetical protein
MAHTWTLKYFKKQMMYVSGETGEPSPETTGMIEEIVRQQVIEMVRIVMPIPRYHLLTRLVAYVHRECCSPWLKVNHNRRSHLPHSP